RQEAGEECRPVAAARCRARAASSDVALGQGPCRARSQRARGSAGARGDRGSAGEGEDVGEVVLQTPFPSPLEGEGRKGKHYRAFSSASAPETSALPGASSIE